jgi:hypothetical protein
MGAPRSFSLGLQTSVFRFAVVSRTTAQSPEIVSE